MDLERSFSKNLLYDKKQPLVLAVDNNIDNLWLVANVLNLCGCSFITATDGQTALHLAEEHQPELILVELMLPGLDGINLVQQLRRNANTVPIIAVTSLVGPQHRERAILGGCNEYIKKPYQIAELEAAIAHNLHLPLLS